MDAPFNIITPKFNIDGNSRDITLTFTIYSQAGITPVNIVIDYWSITDHRGRVIRGEPSIENSYVLSEKLGKKISLVMKGAALKISHDCLDICVRFLVRNGQSIVVHYTYKTIGNTFSFGKIEKAQMTDTDEDKMLDTLVKVAKFEKKTPNESQIAKNKDAEPYDVNIPLNIGIKHECKKQIYENIPFYFKNGEKSRKISVKKCPGCDRYFIDEELYRQNSFYFDKYQLINSYSTQKDEVEMEAPAYLQWSAKHPYQGGGFSGK